MTTWYCLGHITQMLNVVWFQTYLEQTKTKFNKKHKGMNLTKVTSTVGLNSAYLIETYYYLTWFDGLLIGKDFHRLS